MIKALSDARGMLNHVTPLKYDCGKLCSSACCASDGDGQGGVWLFPGEEEVDYGSWGHVIDCAGDSLLICKSGCERDLRPMGCRIFPLVPRPLRQGWDVAMDSRARAMCPLYRSGVTGLDAQFVTAVRKAVCVMANEPALDQFMRRWARRERQFRNNSWI